MCNVIEDRPWLIPEFVSHIHFTKFRMRDAFLGLNVNTWKLFINLWVTHSLSYDSSHCIHF